jgi:hypothetical protein
MQAECQRSRLLKIARIAPVSMRARTDLSNFSLNRILLVEALAN